MTQTPVRPCPRCGQMHLLSMTACGRCGATFPPLPPPEQGYFTPEGFFVATPQIFPASPAHPSQNGAVPSAHYKLLKFLVLVLVGLCCLVFLHGAYQNYQAQQNARKAMEEYQRGLKNLWDYQQSQRNF